MSAVIFLDFDHESKAQSSNCAGVAPSLSRHDLLEMCNSKEWDIALANLLCAQELPGAEQLDVSAFLTTLDKWVVMIKSETKRYAFQFQRNPAEYENSLGYYRMIMMVTVLQKDLGVRYNPESVGSWDFSNSTDVFINGLLGQKRMGTCSSMPVLYVALGRRLGYPLKLVPAKGHLFVRWEDPMPGGERFNIEATSQGILCPSDDHFATWPFPLSQGELASGYFLRSLTPQEELAEFMTMRGNCLEDLKRAPEAVAVYALAHSLVPQSPRYKAFLRHALGDAPPNPTPPMHASPSRAKRRPIRSPDHQPDAWVDALNRHNQQLLAGELPSHSLPPTAVQSSP